MLFRKEMGIICSLLLLSLIWAPLSGRGSPHLSGHCPPVLPLFSAHLALIHTNQLKVKRHKGVVLLPVILKLIVESTWYFGVGLLGNSTHLCLWPWSLVFWLFFDTFFESHSGTRDRSAATATQSFYLFFHQPLSLRQASPAQPPALGPLSTAILCIVLPGHQSDSLV